MKAFLSAPGMQYDRIQRSIEKPSYEAISEAKRILEETEPANAIRAAGRKRYRSIHKLYEWNITSTILAEALENFLKD